MAGIKLKMKARVRASSILEVVISMVIIILVFGITMMIYANVLRLSLSAENIRAQAVLQEAMIRIEAHSDHTSQQYTIDDFSIEQDIKPYSSESGLSTVHLIAYDQNRQQIAKLQKIIISSHE